MGQTADCLDAYYAGLESQFVVASKPRYGPLVVPNGNQELAIHRWFHFKEAYSTRLLPTVLDETGLSGQASLRILDPFSGGGTTSLSLADMVAEQQLGDSSTYGIETNGFLHLLASTKLASVQSPPRGFLTFARKIARDATSRCVVPPAPPSLSTFNSTQYFDPGDVEQLVRLRVAIEAAEGAGAEPLHVALAQVCLGAIVEPISNLRRDGRALRYTEKRSRPGTQAAFLRKAEQIDEDIHIKRVPVRGRIMRGDGRLMTGIDGRFAPFDLIMFSPPYPNNIDYTEIYKLENWLLGFITDSHSFAAQRLSTVYSHPSLLRAEPLPSPLLDDFENANVERIIGPVLESIPLDRYTDARRRMLSGYALDMYLTLRSGRDRLAEDGWLVYIVGNSVHGQPPNRLVVAADLLMAALAEAAGLSVDRVAIARSLKRRAVLSPYLRESVVFIRRSRGN